MRNRERLQQSIIQGAIAVAFLLGMVGFGVWYFHVSISPMPAVPAEHPTKRDQNLPQVSVTDSPEVLQGDDVWRIRQLADCNLTLRVPSSWQISGRTTPFMGTPLEALIMSEPRERAQRTVFWFACFSAQQYELADIIGKDVGLQPVQELIAGSVTWHRTRDFWYTTHHGTHILLQVNFARYDSHPEPGYEDTMLGIMQSIQFGP